MGPVPCIGGYTYQDTCVYTTNHNSVGDMYGSEFFSWCIYGTIGLQKFEFFGTP